MGAGQPRTTPSIAHSSNKHAHIKHGAVGRTSTERASLTCPSQIRKSNKHRAVIEHAARPWVEHATLHRQTSIERARVDVACTEHPARRTCIACAMDTHRAGVERASSVRWLHIERAPSAQQTPTLWVVGPLFTEGPTGFGRIPTVTRTHN